MREVHTNPQTTSAVCWAIFYICQQRLYPILKATKDYYISSMVYRIYRKANRVIQVGSFPCLPTKCIMALRENLKKKISLQLSCRILTEEMGRSLSAQPQAT